MEPRKRRKGKSPDADIRVPEPKRSVTTLEMLERENAVLCSQIADLMAQVGRLREELSATRKQNLPLGRKDNYSNVFFLCFTREKADW